MIKIEKEKFTLDDKGAMVASIRYLADTRSEALREVPSTFEGLQRKGHNITQWVQTTGKYIVDATFKGLIDGEDPGEEFDQFDMDGEFREVSMEEFPYPEILVKQYGAYRDPETKEITFPPKLPQGATSTSGFNKKRGDSDRNPLEGAKSFPIEYQVARHSYVRKKKSKAARKRVGSVVTKLPAGFEEDGDSVWFVAPLKTSRYGSAVRHVETYKEITQMPQLETLMLLLHKGKV